MEVTAQRPRRATKRAMTSRTKRATKREGTPTPRASRKLTLSVGLVNVDVGIAPLMASDNLPRGRMLCPEHLLPIRQASYCEACDGHVETITGYEYDGRFVVVDKDSLAVESDGRVALERVVPVAEIDPLYYEKAYLVWPTDGQGTSYDLLVAVLRDTQQALVGRCVLTKNTRMIVLRWSEAAETLVLHLCQFDANIRWNDVRLVRDGMAARPEPAENHLAGAETLLESLAGEFEPEVEDDYRLLLEQAIENAAKGKAARKRGPEPEPAEVVDLTAALTASIAAAKQKKAQGKKSSKARAKAAA